MNCLLSTAYLPPVQWFSKLLTEDDVFVEQWESYHKQTYRNRCIIDSPNGPVALTIPVEKFANASRLVKDMRISDHDDWRDKHWHALESSYYNSPFFEFYQDDFRPFYEHKYEFLMDFNEALIMKCMELMDVKIELQRTTAFIAPDVVDPSVTKDMRQTISPKISFDVDKDFVPKPYYQVFSQKGGFKPNLSIVDLIFNMGPESILILKT